MGTDIDNEQFDERDYSRFAGRLGECLAALGQSLDRPGFGTGPATIGAELELFLIDGAARPLPHNRAVCAATADPRVNVELNRCNLELNVTPAVLAGRPFTALGGELSLLVDRVADAAGDHGGRVALIGILPTLSPADLGPAMMTDVPRLTPAGACWSAARPSRSPTPRSWRACAGYGCPPGHRAPRTGTCASCPRN